MSETIETLPSTEIAPANVLVPAVVFAPGGMQAVLDKIAADARAKERDPTTDRGRKAIASLAFQIARSKTALDDMGKALTDDWRTRTAAVNEDRRRARDFLDALKEEIRKPLDDYEAAQAARVAAFERDLAAIPESMSFHERASSADLQTFIAWLKREKASGKDWAEFAGKAEATYNCEIIRAQETLDRRLKQEAAAAEAARLEAERIEREQAEAAERQRQREEEIAQRAAEAAKAAAEQKAAEEARAAAAAAAAEREAIERREREAAERAERAERERLQAEARAREAAERAERDRIAAAEAAVAAERQRAEQARLAAEAAARAEQEAADRRAANKAHRATINRSILNALVLLGLTEAKGKELIEAVVRGEVPHVSVTY